MPWGELPFGSAPFAVGGVSVTNTVSCTGVATRLMKSKIRTRRRTEAKSTATAGIVPTYVDHIDSCCAALQVDSESESMVDMREAGELRLRCYTPAAADIKATDIVIPLAPHPYADREFSVESPMADDVGLRAYGKWRLRWVAGGGTR